MAADKDLIQQKYTDIRDAFQKWSNKTYKNVRMYSETYILLKLSEQFYLSPRTIENVVYHRVSFVHTPTNPNQGSLNLQ